jgi:putative heme iron utilization protein
MPRRQNALLSGALYLERSLTELLDQNPDVLEPTQAERLQTAISGITCILPSVKQLARSRQEKINAQELQEGR